MDSRFGFLDLENPQYTFFPDFIGPGKGWGRGRHLGRGLGMAEGRGASIGNVGKGPQQ